MNREGDPDAAVGVHGAETSPRGCKPRDRSKVPDPYPSGNVAGGVPGTVTAEVTSRPAPSRSISSARGDVAAARTGCGDHWLRGQVGRYRHQPATRLAALRPEPRSNSYLL